MHTRPSPPISRGLLQLDDVHWMYWEQSGLSDGQPVVLVHGGPGSGMCDEQRELPDPRHFRIVSYDQRGAGRSRPFGELTDNTTAHLVDDLEKLRTHLGIERWVVMGGSWGSCVSLAYAQSYPERVTALILRGIFLGRQSELDWYFTGVRHVFPEAWTRFIEFLPRRERSQPLTAYHDRVHASDSETHLVAAREWCLYEASCATLIPTRLRIPALDDQQTLVLARLQTHYFINAFFIENNPLLDKTDRIRSIPGEIVQGRYDMICPPWSADALHRAWPEAHYQIVANAGHAASEPGIRRALQAAVERCKQLEIV